MTTEKTYSAKQVASRIGTDAKQLRKFLRDPNSGYEAVGQGGRYDFPESELAKVAAAFTTWIAGKTTRNRSSTPASKVAGVTTPRVKKPSAKIPEGMHGNALDDDPLEMRTEKTIAQRMNHHNLTMKGGRFVPDPKKILNPFADMDLDSIPGLGRKAHVEAQKAKQLVPSAPHGEEQSIIDHAEQDPYLGEDLGDGDLDWGNN